MTWLTVLSLLWACGESPVSVPVPDPVPVPAPVPSCAPDVAFAPPTREVKTPAPAPLTPELERTVKILERVVHEHGRDPDNPWAIGHAMLALGRDVVLGAGACDTAAMEREGENATHDSRSDLIPRHN